jgi:hypothetical protein
MPANDNDPRAGAKPLARGGANEPLALLITRRQRVRLLDLGVTEAELHVMTPADAHRILRGHGEPPSLD